MRKKYAIDFVGNMSKPSALRLTNAVEIRTDALAGVQLDMELLGKSINKLVDAWCRSRIRLLRRAVDVYPAALSVLPRLSVGQYGLRFRHDCCHRSIP